MICFPIDLWQQQQRRHFLPVKIPEPTPILRGLVGSSVNGLVLSGTDNHDEMVSSRVAMLLALESGSVRNRVQIVVPTGKRFLSVRHNHDEQCGAASGSQAAISAIYELAARNPRTALLLRVECPTDVAQCCVVVLTPSKLSGDLHMDESASSKKFSWEVLIGGFLKFVILVGGVVGIVTGVFPILQVRHSIDGTWTHNLGRIWHDW